MAAPEYVPVNKNLPTRAYGSPTRLEEPWNADRPGDLVRFGQPYGPQLGVQGPDIGYALKLAEEFRDRLVLADGENIDDALSGGVVVAMKRAALFGRAPVIHDLTFAFTIWGFFGDAPAELIAVRGPLFSQIANPHHYAERRRVADLVSQEILAQPLSRLQSSVAAEWGRLASSASELQPL